MKNKNKVNIPLLLAGILFCLTLISSSLTSNLIAKYSTTASGSDSARVAKFDVDTTTNSQSDKIELVPGDSDSSGTYKFTIKNNSEVVVKNTIIVKGVPNQVKVVFNGTEKTQTGTDDLTFYVGVLDIGGSVDCTLNFSALGGSATQVTQAKIQVLAEQVD
ncbi:MAG: hypothetical protein EOM34_09055 [Clostridia bacterium]|nr:hypothetical protein [Clostridia bacterium]